MSSNTTRFVFKDGSYGQPGMIAVYLDEASVSGKTRVCVGADEAKGEVLILYRRLDGSLDITTKDWVQSSEKLSGEVVILPWDWSKRDPPAFIEEARIMSPVCMMPNSEPLPVWDGFRS